MKFLYKLPYFVIHLFISFALLTVFFWDLTDKQFIFASDELLFLNKNHAFNSFFTTIGDDLGSGNTLTLSATFFDRLYYILVHFLSIPFIYIQKILYFIKLFVSLTLPFIGFIKVDSLFSKKNNHLAVFAVSLWYSFNIFTLIFWQGTAFSLTFLIGYAIAPFAFYYFHQSIFGTKKLNDIIYAAFSLFLMSFVLYLPAVFALLLGLYTFLTIYIYKLKIVPVLKRLLYVVLYYILFSPVLFIVVYELFLSPSTTVNAVGGETYGLLSGGLLYQLFMWYSWAIYTYWEPRNIFSYYTYFKHTVVMISPFVLYFLVIHALIRKQTKTKILFFTIFLFFLFFIKGAQIPFGELYVFLIDHVGIFRVFRSPDNKFSFGIVFSLSVLLLLSSRQYRNYAFIGIIILVTAIQSYPLFKGSAIRGENTSYSSDRILELPQDYNQAAAFLNNNSFPFSYGITLPNTEIYTHYQVGDSKYIGQDVFQQIVDNPLIYVSQYSGMTSQSYTTLKTALTNGEYKVLIDYPIRYIIVRKDLRFQKITPQSYELLNQDFRKVYENNTFQIFENNRYLPVINAPNSTFTMINPVTFRISFTNVPKDILVRLNQNYNPNWNLYLIPYNEHFSCDGRVYEHTDYQTRECWSNPVFVDMNSLKYAFSSPISQAPSENAKSNNSWLLSPKEIKKDKRNYSANPDGTINFQAVIVFKTQYLLYGGLTASTLIVVLTIFALVKRRK